MDLQPAQSVVRQQGGLSKNSKLKRRGGDEGEQHYIKNYRARSQSLIEEWRFDLILQR
jgi:hypothetical protein